MPSIPAAYPGTHDWQAEGWDWPGIMFALPMGHRMHEALLDDPVEGL